MGDDGDAHGYELQRLHEHDDGYDEEHGMLCAFRESPTVVLLHSMESQSSLLLTGLFGWRMCLRWQFMISLFTCTHTCTDDISLWLCANGPAVSTVDDQLSGR